MIVKKIWYLGKWKRNRYRKYKKYLKQGGMIWEYSIETCTLPYVKQMTNVSSMHETGHPKLVLWDNTKGQGGEGGEGDSRWGQRQVSNWLRKSFTFYIGLTFFVKIQLIICLDLLLALYSGPLICLQFFCQLHVLMVTLPLSLDLDSMLKSKDITLPTKVCISKLWFFQ